MIGPGMGPGLGLGQEHQDGEEETVVTVTPLSSQRVFSTLPSVDSAVESWDGSNVDSSFTSTGARPKTLKRRIKMSEVKQRRFLNSLG